MRVNLDKNLDKDVFHIIKNAIGYPPRSAWNKISYVNWRKFPKNISQAVPPFHLKLK